jgi:hypothetical protein
MDVDQNEWTTLLVRHICVALIKYEDHLRSRESVTDAKALAKAMRELKEVVPDEILEVMRG